MESQVTNYQYFLASPFFAGFKDPESPESKIFSGIFSELSPPLKAFLTSDETAAVLISIGQKYELEERQVSQTAQALRELVLGKIFIKDLPLVLGTKTSLDEDKSSRIVSDLVAQLFNPIVEDLKRIQRIKFTDRIMQLQKESKPAESLNQATAKADVPRQSLTPAQEMIKRQEIQPNQPPVSIPKPATPPPMQQAPIKPPVPPVVPDTLPKQQASQPTRPPLQMPPRPQQTTPEPKTSMPPSFQPLRPPVLPPQQSKPEPSPAPQPKPQFKIPDLGQSFSTPQNKPAVEEGGEKIEDIKKSLEAELEKVANIIDLRDKKEQ